jgi:alkylated DNA repair dioxygenase AlkB
MYYLKLDDLPHFSPVFAAARALSLSSLPDGTTSCLANQAIITRYRDGDDDIGFHSDKMASIQDPSCIVDLSLGAERTFQARLRAPRQVTRKGGKILPGCRCPRPRTTPASWAACAWRTVRRLS